MICHCCGAERDMSVKAVYPYHEQDHIVDHPIDPLMEMDVDSSTASKRALMCHECFHKIGPEMWILEEHWAALNPKTAFADLPDHPGGV